MSGSAFRSGFIGSSRLTIHNLSSLRTSTLPCRFTAISLNPEAFFSNRRQLLPRSRRVRICRPSSRRSPSLRRLINSRHQLPAVLPKLPNSRPRLPFHLRMPGAGNAKRNNNPPHSRIISPDSVTESNLYDWPSSRLSAASSSSISDEAADPGSAPPAPSPDESSPSASPC